MELTILQLTDVLKISFRADEMSWIFAIMTTLVWLMAGIYSFEYMEHDEYKKKIRIALCDRIFCVNCFGFFSKSDYDVFVL